MPVGAAIGVWDLGRGEWERWRGRDAKKGVGGCPWGRGESAVIDGRLKRARRGSRGGMKAIRLVWGRLGLCKVLRKLQQGQLINR